MLSTLTNENEILTWGEDSLKKEILARAAKVLRDGGIIVGPTETSYGLLVRADSPECMRKLFALKGRDKSYPTAIFVRSIEEMKEIAIVNETALRLAREFLPGPLTMVLPANQRSPKRALAQNIVVNGKLGIRISSCEFISGALDEIDFNLTSTSANKHGQPNPSAIAEIKSVFGTEVNLYVDGGTLNAATSTVIDICSDTQILLREGAIDWKKITEVVKA